MNSAFIHLISNKILINISRNMKSALYITGEKAQHLFVPVHPNINFEKRLEEKDKLVNNISRRGLNIDLQRLERRYHFFKDIEEKKTILEQTRDEINILYREITKETNVDVVEVNRLKLHKTVIQEELKSLKEYLYGLEENVMISILNLPNELHETTPESDQVIHTHLEKPSSETESHMDIGLKSNLIELVDSWGCYLKSDASIFELAVSNCFINNLIDTKFLQFQNADFTRSIIVEGCGTNVVNSNKILTIYERNSKNEIVQELSRLHLTGSASTYSFMAYFAKHLVHDSYFPLKYFCYGRSYNGDLRKCDSLFNLNQESCLNVFIAAQNDDIWKTYKEVVDVVKKIYDNIGYHYRLVLLQASKLNRNESMRLSIQMFSNHFQEYVEVGYVSYYDSYISERLLFTCMKNKETVYPKIIGGDILNVQKLLGCILENKSSRASVLSEYLRQYLP